jgi:hypothetical protein
MAMKKIAISLPVLEQVDRLAASRGESRSHLIATVLDRLARAKRDRDVTTQIDALLADDRIAADGPAETGHRNLPIYRRRWVTPTG